MGFDAYTAVFATSWPLCFVFGLAIVHCQSGEIDGVELALNGDMFSPESRNLNGVLQLFEPVLIHDFGRVLFGICT